MKVGDPVPKDGVEPAKNPFVVAKVFQFPGSLHERGLEDVFGIGAITDSLLQKTQERLPARKQKLQAVVRGHVQKDTWATCADPRALGEAKGVFGSGKKQRLAG